MEEALWYVIGGAVWIIAGMMFAVAFVISILLLLVGGIHQSRFSLLGQRGLFSRKAKYGESDNLN